MAHNTAMRLRTERIDGFSDKGSGIVLLHPYFWGKETLGGEPTDAAVHGGFERACQVACAGQLGPDHPYINPMASPEEWRQLGCGRWNTLAPKECPFGFISRPKCVREPCNIFHQVLLVRNVLIHVRT
jgi:hypothetical protein